MFKSLLCASGCAALVSGSAHALPFNPWGFQGGGGIAGVSGVGFTVTNGYFFDGDDASPNVFPSAPGGWTGDNRVLEFDSSFCLDPIGPAVRNRSTGTSNNSHATLAFYGDYGPPGGASSDHRIGDTVPGLTIQVPAGSHIGDPSGTSGTNPPTPNNRARIGLGSWGTDGQANIPVGSGLAPNVTGGRSVFDGVFVGRLTVTRGAVLTGAFDFITFLGTVTPADLFTRELVLGGPAVEFMTHMGLQDLALRSYLVASPDIPVAGLADPAGVNDGAPFGPADVYDLWVQTIPAPGALALVGLGGIAALRRRRVALIAA